MDLPYAQHREKYIELVKEVETELQSTTNTDSISDLSLHTIQQKLDAIAGKYQDDEKIGSARYKMYELQAFLHYFEHQDEKALDFINQAIELRGSTYPKAEKLKVNLTTKSSGNTTETIDESKMTKAEKHKKLIGLDGWLALFIVGQFIALLLTIIYFFSNGTTSSSDIDALNNYQYGLGDSFQSLISFENFALVTYITLVIITLVLLFRRRKLAKGFAIATLLFVAIYTIIDYSTAASLFGSTNLSENTDIQSLLTQGSSRMGEDILAAAIWVPYFFVSKRVKATLNRL